MLAQFSYLFVFVYDDFLQFIRHIFLHQLLDSFPYFKHKYIVSFKYMFSNKNHCQHNIVIQRSVLQGRNRSQMAPALNPGAEHFKLSIIRAVF
jgi:hypothetical protein